MTIPKPPSVVPPSHVNLDSYRSMRKDELEAIRAKGLAKIFNKHFTTVADKISKEREAANIALDEINNRKAYLAENPKEFENAGGWTLTQLEALTVELTRRKQEVMRKERETQELYKRYCSQYGHGSPSPRQGGDSFWKDNQGMPSLPETHTYDGDEDVMRQADLLIAKAMEVTEATKDVNISKLSPKLENGSTPTPSSNIDLSSMLPRKIDSSPVTLPTQLNVKTLVDDDEMMLKLSPTSPTIQNESYTDDESESFLGGVGVVTQTKKATGADDEDNDSEMSGLTSFEAVTVAEAEFKLMEFLRVETDNIRKMLSEVMQDDGNSDDIGSSASSSNFLNDQSTAPVDNRKISEAAKAAEEMAKKLAEATSWINNPKLLATDSDDEDDEKQIEKVVVKEDKNKNSTESKLEWQAYWSSEYNREYYYNTSTMQTCWMKPQNVDIDTSTLQKTTTVADEDDDEYIVPMVDYTKSKKSSRTTKQFKSKSGKSHVDDEEVSAGSGTSSTGLSKSQEYRLKIARQRRKKIQLTIFVLGISLFGITMYQSRERWMPLLGMQTASQKAKEMEQIRLKELLELEEKKLKEEQKQMRLLAEKKAKEEEIKRIEAEALKKAEEMLHQKEMENLRQKKEREAEEKRIQEEIAAAEKAEQERMRKEAEAAAKAQEEEQKKEARLRAEIEEQIRKDEREKMRAEEEAIRLAEEEANREADALQVDVQVEKKSNVLPRRCKVPFFYIISSRCRILSKETPVFDLKGLTDAMMQ